jgi:hypothetical protein
MARLGRALGTPSLDGRESHLDKPVPGAALLRGNAAVAAAATSSRAGRRWSGLLLLALAVAACAAPVSAVRVSPERVHRELTTNVLTAGRPSTATGNVLYELNLRDQFEEHPEEALAVLHRHAVGTSDADALFALAELSFLHAGALELATPTHAASAPDKPASQKRRPSR